MPESSSKRPPQPALVPPPRPAATAIAAAEAATAALPPPAPEPVLARKLLPPAIEPVPARKGTAMPDPVALFDAFAHGAEAYADEMAGLLQAGFATATDTAKAMLAAKTLTEAFEINAGFIRKSLDTMLAGSVRLTDITTRLAAESLQPLIPAR
jgi:phasin family protein